MRSVIPTAAGAALTGALDPRGTRLARWDRHSRPRPPADPALTVHRRTVHKGLTPKPGPRKGFSVRLIRVVAVASVAILPLLATACQANGGPAADTSPIVIGADLELSGV